MKFLLFPAAGFGLAICAAFAADHDTARQAVMAGRFKPLAEILTAVQTRYDGRVLDVELDRDQAGRNVYEVKLLAADGSRREIHIDAVTGKEVSLTAPPQFLSMPVLLRQVLLDHPGRVIDVDLRHHQNRFFYQVRVMDKNGQSGDVFVDAVTGAPVADTGFLRDDMMPLADLLETLLKRYHGNVQEVELKYDRDARPFYEVDLQLDSGMLVEVSLDPFNGHILSEDEIEVR